MSGAIRVLHAPVEVAGQAALAAYGLRAVGVPAHAFARPHAYRYPVGPDIVPGPGRVAWACEALRAARTHDVFHFYFGASFLPEALRGIDARALRGAGRRVVVEFLGSDIRMPGIEARRNPHYVPLDHDDDADAERRMRRWSAITGGHAIVCDRALTAFAERCFAHVHVVPFRVDTAAFRPAPPTAKDVDVPVIVHAPSRIAAKGTPHVRAAIETLRTRGAQLDYVELHGVSQEAVHEACRRADIVVDQLCSGSHGVFAVEAMSMAKPVVCNILPELVSRYPVGFPIVPATPETIADVLGDLLARPRERHQLGLASRAYAERVHDVRAVAQQLLEVYAQLPRGRFRASGGGTA
ncbi:MAG TPA: glycosyltransferase [Conexibacter sp.]|nr:glycosyltransferase [Conexibacter sp.]